MERNMNDWLRALAEDFRRQAMPIMTYPGLELAGKTIMEIVTSGEAQAQCMAALASRYPMAASVTTMDLSVEAEAFGAQVRFSEAEVPAVVGRCVSTAEEVASLAVPFIGTARTGQYLDAARLAAESIRDRPVFGGCIGPFSLAGRLYDMTEIMVDLMLEPQIIHALLEKCTQFLIDFAKALKATGANGVIMAEPAAGLLAPVKADAFSSQYIKRIVAEVQDESFLLVLHNCGNTVKLVPSMLDTGAAGFHFGNAVDLGDILPQFPQDRLVSGNIDPANVLKSQSPQAVQEATEALLDKTASYPNFLLSSGCDIPPGTPLENIEALFQALAAFNNRAVC